MTDQGLYVYGVVRAGHRVPPGLRGVGGPAQPTRVIREGWVAAVVSPAPPDLRARRRDLLAHQELLLTLSAHGPVLPMRFGMVATDEAAVRRQLADGEAHHSAVLDRVADRVEINVKAMPANDSLAALVRDDPSIRRLRETVRSRPTYEANLRLGEAVATALSRRAAESGRQIVQELDPMAQAAASGPGVPGCLVNMSFLVDRDDTAAFTAEAERLAQQHRDRVELKVAGPLPCYSFLEQQPSTASVGA